MKNPLKRQWLSLCMNIIDKKVKQFEEDHFCSLERLSPVMRKHYLALVRSLIEKEQMPKETLIQLAHRIKPLMRPQEESSLEPGLYWCQPEPLTQSFYFNFDDNSVVHGEDDKILPVNGLEKVCEFTCYHRYGGFYGCLRPGMDEVIQQFPMYLLADEKAEYAIELEFTSKNVNDIYDRVLDRHVSTVIVYQMKNGLPREVREQEVIYE